MIVNRPSTDETDLTLRQAALIAGIGVLLLVVFAPFAEYFVYSKLVVPGDVGRTVENIRAERGLFLAGVVSYVMVFILDLVVAWAFYVFLAPAGRSVSLLAAWFRVVYTAVAFFGMTKLVTVFRLLHAPAVVPAAEGEALHAPVGFLLESFRHEWGIALVFFGVHLLLLGYLVFRADYVPAWLGILLVVNGLGWVVHSFGPLLLPDADLGWLMITFFGEPVFMVWLLVRGRGIEAAPTP